MEALGEGVSAVLGLRDGDIAIADELLGHGDEETAGGVEGFVEASGEEAALEMGYAEHGLLGQGDALDGEQPLGVDGPVDGDEIGAERALPAGVRGPVEWDALTRFAASCFSEMFLVWDIVAAFRFEM